MSLRPGIGANAMGSVSLAMMRNKLELVPLVMRREGKKYPIGRYLRRKAAELLSGDEAGIKSLVGAPGAVAAASKELQLVRSVAWATGRSVQEVITEVRS